MTKEDFSIISDRFLEKAYGKNDIEILALYQNDEQFKADYEAVQQKLVEVFEPIVLELYEAVRKIVESAVKTVSNLVESNPEFFEKLMNNSCQNLFQSASY